MASIGFTQSLTFAFMDIVVQIGWMGERDNGLNGRMNRLVAGHVREGTVEGVWTEWINGYGKDG